MQQRIVPGVKLIFERFRAQNVTNTIAILLTQLSTHALRFTTFHYIYYALKVLLHQSCHNFYWQ